MMNRRGSVSRVQRWPLSLKPQRDLPQATMQAGELVPDKVVLSIIRERCACTVASVVKQK